MVPDATALETARAVHAAAASQGSAMLDAPVSGGEKGAIDAALSIMVGGDKTDFEKALPIFGRRRDSPDVPGSLQFDADLAEFARSLRRKNGANARMDNRRMGALGSSDLHGDPTLGGIVMTGGIATAVKIHGDGGSSLLKTFAAAIGAVICAAAAASAFTWIAPRETPNHR